MNQELLRRLKDIRLFEGICQEDLPHMLTCICGVERTFLKQEYIFMEGEDLKQIGVVVRGAVQMIKEDVWGGKVVLATCSQGDIFGESFVCNDRIASTVSFLTASDCEILFLPFRRLLTTCGMACRFHHHLIENMVVMIAEKNVTMMRKLEIISKKTIRERIMVWVSHQVQHSGNRRFTSLLGRGELAEYLCVDRSALTREMTNMKREGLLDFTKNTFELK